MNDRRWISSIHALVYGYQLELPLGEELLQLRPELEILKCCHKHFWMILLSWKILRHFTRAIDCFNVKVANMCASLNRLSLTSFPY